MQIDKERYVSLGHHLRVVAVSLIGMAADSLCPPDVKEAKKLLAGVGTEKTPVDLMLPDNQAIRRSLEMLGVIDPQTLILTARNPIGSAYKRKVVIFDMALPVDEGIHHGPYHHISAETALNGTILRFSRTSNQLRRWLTPKELGFPERDCTRFVIALARATAAPQEKIRLVIP